MSLIFTKNSVESNPITNQQFEYMKGMRIAHDVQSNNALKGIPASMGGIAANQSALIPFDQWREVDVVTKRVFMNDEGQEYLTSLLTLAKPLNIGKTAYVYRKASDKENNVIRSLSGQNPETMNKTNYEYAGDPVPIFNTGYGRPWREQTALINEGFDALVDDQERTLREIKENMAIYMLYGDDTINVKGYSAKGITNHQSTVQIDLGGSGANIDLTSATADQIITFFTVYFAGVLDSNYCSKVDELYVSPQIMRNFNRPYSGSGDFKEGTIKDYIERYGRVGEIKSTFELGRDGKGTGAYNVDGKGNEFFCFVKNQQAICPLVGQGVSTIAMPRLKPMDDYNFMVWGAMGLRIQSDANGRSQVFYASVIS